MPVYNNVTYEEFSPPRSPRLSIRPMEESRATMLVLLRLDGVTCEQGEDGIANGDAQGPAIDEAGQGEEAILGEEDDGGKVAVHAPSLPRCTPRAQGQLTARCHSPGNRSPVP